MAQANGQSEAPFQNIALSLSGGGTRAVGFHLGTLSYLHRSGLLEQVRILSTVSGGTLVGASYTLSLEEDISFQDLFYDFFEFFPKINMVEGLMEIMTRRDRPVKSGRRDLATAFAELYHEEFFSRYFASPYFGAIDAQNDNPRQHLEDITFNATEFRSGIAFRFQKSRHACKVGNGKVWIEPNQANEMRIADVVSASSCIPGGFEPFRFPGEFHWPDTYRWGAKKGAKFDSVRLQTMAAGSDGDDIALMDGGVYDNQGTTSVLLAISRRTGDTDTDFEADEDRDPQSWASWAHRLLSQYSLVDLFIVSDTPVLKEPLYSPAGDMRSGTMRQASWFGRRTLGDVSRFAWIVTVILLASAVASFVRLVQTGQVVELKRHLVEGPAGFLPLFYEGVATLIPLAVAALLGAVLLSLRRQIHRATQSLQHRLPKFEHPPWHYLKQIRMSDLWTMLRLRAGSLMALSADIYMHRIRQLGYSLLFSHKELVPALLANEIHSIAQMNDVSGTLPSRCANVSAEVRAIVGLCSGMATKGWFDPLSVHELRHQLSSGVDDATLTGIARRGNDEARGDLDILTACGELTTCYNLIRYLDNALKRAGTGPQGPAVDAVRALFERACEDWNRLQEAPFAFVEERLQAGRSAQHANQIAANVARRTESARRMAPMAVH